MPASSRRNFSRIVASATGVLLVSLSMAGCSTCSCDPSPNSALPQPSNQTESPVETQIVTEVVEDELGRYSREILNKTPIPWRTVLAPSLNESEIAELQSWIVNFVNTEVLDSIALDDESKLQAWHDDVAPNYLHPDLLYQLRTSSSNYQFQPRQLIFSNSLDQVFESDGQIYGLPYMPQRARDGSSRVKTKRILVAELFEFSREDYEGEQLIVEPLYRLLIRGYIEFEVTREEVLEHTLLRESYVQKSAEDQNFDLGYTLEEAIGWVESRMKDMGNPEMFSIESEFFLDFTAVRSSETWLLVNATSYFETSSYGEESVWFDPLAKANSN